MTRMLGKDEVAESFRIAHECDRIISITRKGGVRRHLWAAAFIGLNLADALLTAWALHHGHHEANSAMAFLVALAGIWGFAALKMVAAVTIAAWLLHKRSWVLYLGTVMVGLVVAWNIVLLTFCTIYGTL